LNILWSCIATLFISTWTVQHLDVPWPNYKGRQGPSLRKLKWVACNRIMPEYLAATAINQFWATKETQKMFGDQTKKDWTFTQFQRCTARQEIRATEKRSLLDNEERPPQKVVIGLFSVSRRQSLYKQLMSPSFPVLSSLELSYRSALCQLARTEVRSGPIFGLISNYLTD